VKVKTEPTPASRVDARVQADDEQVKREENDEPQVEVEYVAEDVPADAGAFAAVFERFSTLGGTDDDDEYTTAVKSEARAGDSDDELESDNDEDNAQHLDDDGQPKPSRKERKRLKLQQVGLLKQIAARPDIVEVWDATAPDPAFLVHLKSYRNTVPVPRHWCRKKRYLQGKRGVDKKPFELPDFIQATGIAKLREAYVEREAAKKLRQKARERTQPKMGKMDINYQVLHDAFFKHQSKPTNLTKIGDLYYEGREYETNLTSQKPGQLSPELRAALGIGPDDPPPWLFIMQRVGPPPSYPNLKIPGLNAPIPHGKQFGFNPGQWGKVRQRSIDVFCIDRALLFVCLFVCCL